MLSTDNEYVKYTTRAGDTFDLLALAAYNNEKYASLIISANPLYTDTLVFGAGVELKIPVVTKSELPATLPPWRR